MKATLTAQTVGLGEHRLEAIVASAADGTTSIWSRPIELRETIPQELVYLLIGGLVALVAGAVLWLIRTRLLRRPTARPIAGAPVTVP